jgi:uncharacterized phage protein (TIGR02218 family)
MRTISTALANHLAGEVLTVATLWKIVRTDGQTFGFTDHDQDLVVSGINYASTGGHTSSAIVWADDLSTSNQEVTAVFDSSAINAQDVAAGLWDYAAVTLYLVNYANLSMGTLPLTTGVLGQVTVKRGQFVAELRGLAQLLQQEIGSLYSATCRAKLGDSRCTVNLAPLTVNATVTTAVNQRVFTAASLTQAGPTVTYDSGSYAIPSSSPRTITPLVPQGGSWVADVAVTFTQTQAALTKVTGTPGQGQYAVTAGVYSFSGSDSGKKVVFTFTYAQGFFTYGLVTWLTGANAGYQMDVRQFSPGTVTLALPMTYPIAVGDTFTIVAGCDKTAATCKSRFANLLNFRGEPFIPGTDAILRVQR